VIHFGSYPRHVPLHIAKQAPGQGPKASHGQLVKDTCNNSDDVICRWWYTCSAGKHAPCSLVGFCLMPHATQAPQPANVTPQSVPSNTHNFTWLDRSTAPTDHPLLSNSTPTHDEASSHCLPLPSGSHPANKWHNTLSMAGIGPCCPGPKRHTCPRPAGSAACQVCVIGQAPCRNNRTSGTQHLGSAVFPGTWPPTTTSNIFATPGALGAADTMSHACCQVAQRSMPHLPPLDLRMHTSGCGIHGTDACCSHNAPPHG
jgi:hypothetical protein